MTVVDRAVTGGTDGSGGSPAQLLDVDDAAAQAFWHAYPGRRLRELAVVIAAYNEEGGIAGVLRAMPGTVRGLGVDVIVVVDGAVDRTAERAASVPGVLVADVPVNRGQGAALRLGYRLAREGGARYIATMDGDGQYDPGELELLLEPLLADRADFVSGSRRLGVAHTTDRVRGTGVVLFAAVLSVLARTRITDPANGLRAMRAEVTAAVPLHQPQYQASELLLGAALRGFRLAEVPTTMRRRSAGSTKKGRNLLYGARFARAIAATWWRLSVSERFAARRARRAPRAS